MKIMNPYPNDLRANTQPGRRGCAQVATDLLLILNNMAPMRANKEAPGAWNTEGFWSLMFHQPTKEDENKLVLR